jgi:hypothetical protein
VTAPVFVVTLSGRERPGGRRLTVLAFTVAGDEAAALARAAGQLAAEDWREVEALRAGEVVDEAAVPDDFAAAMANARRFGCALIIYDED